MAPFIVTAKFGECFGIARHPHDLVPRRHEDRHLCSEPPACDVFETDLTLHVAELGWESWRNIWLLIAYGVSLNGHATVLCGSLTPEQLDAAPARPLVGPSTSQSRLPRRDPGHSAAPSTSLASMERGADR
jgi:hypothetical protein